MACPQLLLRIGLVVAFAAWGDSPSHASSTASEDPQTADPAEAEEAEETEETEEAQEGPTGGEETSAPAEEQGQPETSTSSEVPSSEEVSPTAQERLDAAWRNYQLGKRELARTELAELVTDAGIDDLAIRQQARIYLGELLYVQDDEEGARRFFEQVLQEDPNYTIDPFRHPPDVVGFFTYVRSYVVPITTPVDPPGPIQYPRTPVSTWAPFGAYHLTHQAPRRGTLYLVGGLATAATSLILFGALEKDRTYAEGEDAEYLRLRRLKAAQYSATGSFYVLWSVSVYDANNHWLRNRRPLGEETPVLSVSGRF